MRYHEIISEGRDAFLYHTMNFDKAENVFKHDLMEAKWEHEIPGYGKVLGNSFTRNPKLRWMSGSITISINQAALVRRNKIIPLDGQFVFGYQQGYYNKNIDRSVGRADPREEYKLNEEFVIGDIKSLHRYVIGIKLNDPNDDFYLLNTYNMCDQYSKKWNIPLTATPSFLEYLEKARKREPNNTTFWGDDF